MYTETEKVDITTIYHQIKNQIKCLSPTFKKGRISGDQNKCRKCNIIYRSKADIHMDPVWDSVWVNCEQCECQYWVHMRCLGFVIHNKNFNIFEESMKYFCP